MRIYQPLEYCVNQYDTGLKVGEEVVVAVYSSERSGNSMYYVHPLLNQDGVICRDPAVTKYHGYCSSVSGCDVYAKGVHKVTELDGREITLDDKDLHPDWQ